MNTRSPNRHATQQRYRRCHRRGVVAIDAAITLAVLMVIAMLAYKMACISSGNLYHVISVGVGSPYL